MCKCEVLGGSCFSIKAEFLRLGNFSEGDVRNLYGQHTADSGQIFEDTVFDKVMALTDGQPWLVDSLARELTDTMLNCRQDRSHNIGLFELEETKERLILRCDSSEKRSLMGVRLR